MKHSQQTSSGFRRWVTRTGLLMGGVIIGLVVAELALTAIDKPRFYDKHTSTARFEAELVDEQLFYLNTRSTTILFEYDGNPRGYFGPDNEVEHRTNSLGFRGPEFRAEKLPGTLRLMFLGDSFTFGEGVRFDDTYSEVTAALLREKIADGRHVEAYNFGVGGYNTTQSLALLRMYLEQFSSDAVVLGYVPNDAEPPLFAYDAATKSVSRRSRGQEVSEGVADELPPDKFIFHFRCSQLVWQFLQQRSRSQATVAFYCSLYDESSPGWQESREALQQISETCRSRNIPFYVVLFPILHELTEDYPFRDIHAKIAEKANACGAIFVDLLPMLKGSDAGELWVHPTDQHPNEKVHAIAANALVEQILRHEVVEK